MESDEVEELLQGEAAPLNAPVHGAPLPAEGALQGATTWAHVPTGSVSEASIASSERSGAGRERKRSSRGSESGSEAEGQKKHAGGFRKGSPSASVHSSAPLLPQSAISLSILPQAKPIHRALPSLPLSRLALLPLPLSSLREAPRCRLDHLVKEAGIRGRPRRRRRTTSPQEQLPSERTLLII